MNAFLLPYLPIVIFFAIAAVLARPSSSPR